MVAIKDLAAAANLIIVATIHQPSSKVYNSFDQVMLLSGGREAYCGTAAKAAEYFSDLGWPMEANTNPAEFFLDLVNADFIPQSDVDKILNAWGTNKNMEDMELEIIEPATAGDMVVLQRSLCHESIVMLKRHALLSVRDPVFYIGRGLIFFMSNLYFAFVYWEARQREQDQVFNRMFLVIWYVGVAANMGVVAVFVLNEEYKSVHKEVRGLGLVLVAIVWPPRLLLLLQLSNRFLFLSFPDSLPLLF